MNFIDYLVRAPQGIVPRAPHFQASQISTKQARLTDLKTTTTSGSSVNIIPFEEWAATRDIQDAAKPTLAIENAVGAFHILCIHCGIVPAFDITESPLYSFHGKVTFANYVVEEEGPFPSKKDAKKAVALKAMPIVQSLLEANKKAAEQDVQKEGSSVRSDDSHGENYVGILTEFCQAERQPLPVFRFLQTTAQSFTCTTTLSKWPGVIFGDAARNYTTKKAAKSYAARSAVQWLRENGHMEGNQPPKKRARISISGDSIDGLDVVAATLKGPSYAQQVADYCPTLGLSPPTYRIEDDPSAPALYSGSAFFAAGSDVSGPVGSVRNVYGKKNAKEELAKQVLRFLELETEKRKAQAAAMRAEFARRKAQAAAI